MDFANPEGLSLDELYVLDQHAHALADCLAYRAEQLEQARQKRITAALQEARAEAQRCQSFVASFAVLPLDQMEKLLGAPGAEI